MGTHHRRRLTGDDVLVLIISGIGLATSIASFFWERYTVPLLFISIISLVVTGRWLIKNLPR